LTDELLASSTIEVLLAAKLWFALEKLLQLKPQTQPLTLLAKNTSSASPPAGL
jgi:hypothetical protein